MSRIVAACEVEALGMDLAEVDAVSEQSAFGKVHEGPGAADEVVTRKAIGRQEGEEELRAGPLLRAGPARLST